MQKGFLRYLSTAPVLATLSVSALLTLFILINAAKSDLLYLG